MLKIISTHSKGAPGGRAYSAPFPASDLYSELANYTSKYHVDVRVHDVLEIGPGEPVNFMTMVGSKIIQAKGKKLLDEDDHAVPASTEVANEDLAPLTLPGGQIIAGHPEPADTGPLV